MLLAVVEAWDIEILGMKRENLEMQSQSTRYIAAPAAVGGWDSEEMRRC